MTEKEKIKMAVDKWGKYDKIAPRKCDDGAKRKTAATSEGGG